MTQLQQIHRRPILHCVCPTSSSVTLSKLVYFTFSQIFPIIAIGTCKLKKQTISMFIKQITFNKTLVQIRQSNKQQRESLKVEVKINSKYFSKLD